MTEGYWARDNSHFPAPMSRYLWDLFLPAYDEGTRKGLARYGCALDHFEYARIGGRLYIRSCFVNSQEKLRRRQKAAEFALESKLWRQDRAAWPRIEESLRCRLLGLARRDPAAMNLAELRGFIAALSAIFKEGTIQHFVQQPSSMVPVGDWIRKTCEWTGAHPSEVIPLLGAARPSGYVRSIDRLAAAVRENRRALALFQDDSSDAGTRLEEFRTLSPEFERVFGEHLDEYADRIVTGFDITEATLRELPQLTLALIASRMEPLQPAADAAGAEDRLAGVRERRPPPPPPHFF